MLLIYNIIFFILLYIIFFYINTNINILEKELYNNNYILPKVIYTYWDNLDNNKIINSHIETWKRNIPDDWKIEVITKKNVYKYVDPDFITKFKSLPAFRFADFLRVYLLYNYGGVWFDGGIILTNGNFLNKYHEEMIKNNYDITLYEFKTHSYKNYPYLENWFLMAPKNSKFLNDLYNEFVKSFDMGFFEYKINILAPSIELKSTLKYGEKTYHMQHAIIHYLLNNNYKYNLNIKDAEESMFKIHKNMNWDSDKIINFIVTNKNWKDYYAIKLVKFNRKPINNNIELYVNSVNKI